MVGPAAKRAAVAHLQAVMSLSERRACSIVGADRKMIRYRSSRPPDAVMRGRLRDLANERRRFGYRRLFVLLRREGEGSTGFTGFIARKGSPSASDGLAARPSGPGPRSLSSPGPMPAGRWTSSTTSSPMADASASSTSSTTSPRNAWALFRTRRSRGGAWPANSRQSSSDAASQE
nr:transposase and inactivated derivatives [Bradyrhizobium sp. DOA9]